MIHFEQRKHKPARLKWVTGLTVEGFLALLPALGAADDVELNDGDKRRGTPRQRERGAGQKGALPQLTDKLVFIRFDCRRYPIQMAPGFLFGMGQPQANAWIHRLSPVLKAALGYALQLPARRSQDIKAILETCPGLELIIDGTERPLRRPLDGERQRANYRGKKKRHTVKNNVVSAKRTGKIQGLRPTVEGNRQDTKRADEQDGAFPPGSTLWKDTGFPGYEPKHVKTLQPTKKPKSRDWSLEEKAANRIISSDRIGMEHSRGGVKVFRIVYAVFRNLREGDDDMVLEIACRLYNFRLDHPLTA
jgi:hypothetical protein